MTSLFAAEARFFSMEHIHVLINHVPVIGLAMAILALVLALLCHSRKPEILGLILVFVAAASAWPVVFTGQHAYKSVRAMTDDGGTEWLDAHMERAEKVEPAFYALALLAAAALIVPYRWPRSTRPLAIATLALAVFCEGAGSWVALAGGQIRHPEFRDEATPSTDPESKHMH